MRLQTVSLALVLVLLSEVAACNRPAQERSAETNTTGQIAEGQRIVTLDPSATEIVFALGAGEKLIGRDKSSYYPPEANRLPDVGYHNQLNPEGILALGPTLVIGGRKKDTAELITAIESAGVKFLDLGEEASLDAAREKIRTIAEAVGEKARGEELIATLDADIERLREEMEAAGNPEPVRASFLYMRGTQTIFLCGPGNSTVELLKLAGAVSAVQGIEGCKPMSAEALVNADPQVLVVYESGLASVGGMEGFLSLPGFSETTAGREKRIIAMDDLYIGAFGPRTGKAALDLFRRIHNVSAPVVTDAATE